MSAAAVTRAAAVAAVADQAAADTLRCHAARHNGQVAPLDRVRLELLAQAGGDEAGILGHQPRARRRIVVESRPGHRRGR